ncbi:hypothetical protein BURKHO8Y_170287 [Burkholderia sp. 8Y]|nr:hypothetical protein BURKHO8Y_170287 [Burkholderia sp. 8Y]
MPIGVKSARIMPMTCWRPAGIPSAFPYGHLSDICLNNSPAPSRANSLDEEKKAATLTKGGWRALKRGSRPFRCAHSSRRAASF